MASRGFEIVKDYEEVAVLPIRKTASSAGYDFVAAQDVTIEPQTSVLVPTGIKAFMLEDEYLGLYIRSSIAIKRNLSLINNVGIIDSDYYNNPDNEGHIMVPIFNLGKNNVHIEKGTRIAQGIFHKYLLVDDDTAGIGNSRKGGFGSTGN